MAATGPPFGFRIEGPDDWALLETAPNRWQRSLERLLDPPDQAGRLPAPARRELAGILEDLVAVAQRTGVVVCLVKLGRDAAGRLFLGNLTLGWYDSTPVPADLALARLVVGDDGDVEDFETPTGPGLLHRSTEPVPAEWRELVGGATAYAAQALVPVPGTRWTALVSGTTGDLHHRDLLTRLVRRMAGSLEIAA